MFVGSQPTDTRLILIGIQFWIPFFWVLCFESIGAWTFETIVEDSNASSQSPIHIRVEYLFAY